MVDALIARIGEDCPGAPIYVLHMSTSVALRLPGLHTGVLDSRRLDDGQISEIRGAIYRGWEVVPWPDEKVAEKVTASPLQGPGDAQLRPVYVLDLLTGHVTRY